MIIGIPKEIKEGENRVSMTPAGVHALVSAGHHVLLEKGAGTGSGLIDEEYAQQGAEVVESGRTVFARSDMIVKVKEPLETELSLLQEGQVLFTYLHLASSEKLTKGLIKTKVTGIAYETMEDMFGRLPLLIPMSEVAGRISVQVAMRFLESDHGGRGVLLSGVPGVPPAEVVIIGGGIAGLNAARIASGLGAHVTVIEISQQRLRYIEDIMRGRVMTVYSTSHTIERSVQYADVLIGAVLVPGAKAPVVVSERMVSRMKPGSVIVDVSIDQGGCIETTRPTSHSEPTYRLYDVIHYAVPNMPASVPRTSTFALTNATIPYVQTIASVGVKKAALSDPMIASGINVRNGAITHRAVAEAFGMKWKKWNKA
ncbi:MAG: alanine dehydrogenase [Syntrophorhabdaceae bacterium]|nr:alanine dehydrogenase [Syntrophorhabdaceae bacterium]